MPLIYEIGLNSLEVDEVELQLRWSLPAAYRMFLEDKSGWYLVKVSTGGARVHINLAEWIFGLFYQWYE
jgi:hypothetical protein